jgi:hypothetical protein
MDDEFQDPLILSFSPQARLGELAIISSHIRKRIWLEKGRPNKAQSTQQRPLSAWGEGWAERVLESV